MLLSSSSILWLSCWLPVSVLATRKPNILFILTDDQDLHMESMQHMPLVQKHLIDEGTVFNNHFCTVALCCPSRVNLWTGRAAHNTNVTDIFPPYGGYPKIVREGIHQNFLPVWMQQAGYNTYYTGKLWNAHTVDNYDSPYAEGFNGSDFLLDPYTYQYYNARMSRNGQPPVSYKGQYSPDVVAGKAYAFLREATTHDEPWMLTVAPIAPHSDVVYGLDKFTIDHPAYAPRHAHLFHDYKIPRTSNFNPAQHHGVSWMRDLPRLNDTVIEYNDDFQRARLRALQSVDEMVGNLLAILEEEKLLDDTYVVYTTDNGYHISQHRLHPGKMCGFDTDIHIPLVVRGPDIPRGRVSDVVTSHTDLAPTILGLAGKTRPEFDGTAIELTQQKSTELSSQQEHVNVEFWGNVIPEGLWGKYGDVVDPTLGSRVLAENNTYKGLRLVAPAYSLYYSVWCTGEQEYYDVKLDPGQVQNYFADAGPPERYEIGGRSFEEVIPRLDALMMVLKSCKGDACRDPWNVLHPDGTVHSLVDALSSSFDRFYRQQPKVTFSSCELGYIKAAEGPQHVNAFQGTGVGAEQLPVHSQQTFQYQGHWSDWT